MEPSDFLSRTRQNNITIEIRGADILTLTKRFPAGSNEEYVKAETDVSIIYEAPQTSPGSTWGTDGGSIGGMVGLRGGYMTLNRSGVSKRWLNKLRKLM
jgi:hypothetical protein